MATHSSVLAWEIPQTEQPDGLQSEKEGPASSGAYILAASLNPRSTMASPVCAARGPVFCIAVTKFISFVTLIVATSAFQALHQDRDVCSSHAPCPILSALCCCMKPSRRFLSRPHWPWPSHWQLEGRPGALYPGNCYCGAGGWAFLPNKGRSAPTLSLPRGPYSWEMVGKEAGEMK